MAKYRPIALKYLRLSKPSKVPNAFLVHLHIKKIFKVYVHTAKPKELSDFGDSEPFVQKEKTLKTAGYLLTLTPKQATFQKGETSESS